MVNLRRFNKCDAISYLAIANDKLSCFPFGFCANLKEAQYVIDTYMSDELDAYAIVKNNILIGAIYAETYAKLDIGTVEVSYIIGQKFQRKGYATQALGLFEQILIENRIQKIMFAINPNNVASVKTAIKFGANFYESKKNLDYYEKVII